MDQADKEDSVLDEKTKKQLSRWKPGGSYASTKMGSDKLEEKLIKISGLEKEYVERKAIAMFDIHLQDKKKRAEKREQEVIAAQAKKLARKRKASTPAVSIPRAGEPSTCRKLY